MSHLVIVDSESQDEAMFTLKDLDGKPYRVSPDTQLNTCIGAVLLPHEIFPYFLSFLYKFHNSLSIIYGIASSSIQLQLEGGMNGEEPSTLLSFCLYQVDIIVVM